MGRLRHCTEPTKLPHRMLCQWRAARHPFRDGFHAALLSLATVNGLPNGLGLIAMPAGDEMLLKVPEALPPHAVIRGHGCRDARR
jgi:hypothetical protein